MGEPRHTPERWQAEVDGVSTDEHIAGNIVCEAPEEYADSMAFWPANARLIAAAPGMLEALEAAEKLYQRGLLFTDSDEIARVHELRRAAIARATGDTTHG